MKIGRESKNTARKLAKDIFTIPNAITLTGGVLAWRGAEKLDSTRSIALLAGGRSLDVIDGFVARLTGQTSDIGAALDAVGDKLVMIKTLYEMHKQGAAPEAILGTIATLNTVNFLATGITNIRSKEKGETRPTKSGKLAMAGETATLIAYAAAHAAEHSDSPELAKGLRCLGATAFAASLPLALHASAEYVNRAIK